MTTICLSHPKRKHQPFKVWGNYDGPDDRFIFDVREFPTQAAAEKFAKQIMSYHAADHFERITN